MERGSHRQTQSKPLLNLKELVNFRGNDSVARQGPREIYGRNISLFLGQEMIAHRWNLQWEYNGVAPPRGSAKAPFTGSVQI